MAINTGGFASDNGGGQKTMPIQKAGSATSPFISATGNLPAQPTFQPITNNYSYTPNTQGVGQWQAPKVQLPNYAGMPQLADYTGRIQEYANRAQEAGLKQLQELTFNPEYQAERERIESRGLTGAGVENEVLKNLMTSQQARAGEFATNIQNKAFEQQTQELQTLRGLEFERQNMQLEQSFQKAIQEGDWEQAKNIHQDSIRLDLENMNMQNEQFKANYGLEIEKFNQDASYRTFMAGLESEKLALDRELAQLQEYEVKTGISQEDKRIALEERQLDIAEREQIANETALAGYQGEYFDARIRDVYGDEYFSYQGNYKQPQPVVQPVVQQQPQRRFQNQQMADAYAEAQKMKFTGF